jgi:hypothetical protein
MYNKMKNLAFNAKGKSAKAGLTVGLLALSGSAMALDQAQADTIVTAVLAAAAIAIAAGYAIFAVVKGAKVGMALLSAMVSKGARG